MLPVDFSYWTFATLLFFNSIGMGMFIAPNQTGIMNSLPANHRGAGAGMAGTFNASAQVLSIGIFFTLMILGLASDPADGALPRPRQPGRRVRPPPCTSPTCPPSAASLPHSSATTRCRPFSAPRRWRTSRTPRRST